MSKLLSILLLISLTGCGTFRFRPAVMDVAKNYETVVGILGAPVELRNKEHRIVIYLQEKIEYSEKDTLLRDGNGDLVVDIDGDLVKTPEPNKAADKSVIMAIADNETNKEVLQNIQEYLNDPGAKGKLIYLYGTKVTGSYKEYASGIDFDIFAIGLYIPSTGKYVVVVTGYGDGVFDSWSWKEFFKKVGSAAVDKAL